MLTLLNAPTHNGKHPYNIIFVKANFTYGGEFLSHAGTRSTGSTVNCFNCSSLNETSLCCCLTVTFFVLFIFITSKN